MYYNVFWVFLSLAINVKSAVNCGFLPDITLLTQCSGNQFKCYDFVFAAYDPT